jgi:hypothetical protein
MISKKAMGIGQVFIFIVAAITFGLIMIFGYKAIAGFISQGEQVEFVQFKNDLENNIKKIYTEYGSVRTITFDLPVDFKRICFVDMNWKDGDVTPPDCVVDVNDRSKDLDPVACSVWKNAGGYDSVDENVFLDPVAPVKIKVFNIEVDGGYLCIPVRKGSFSLRLEGKGDRTKIQIPPSENGQ